MGEYRIDDSSDFEKLIAMKLKASGLDVEIQPKNNKGYDLVAKRKDGSKIAVEVKNYKKQVISQPQIKKFYDFLSQPYNKEIFQGGMFVTSTKFAKTVYSYLESEGIKNIILVVYDTDSGKIKRVSSDFSLSDPDKVSVVNKNKYVGVFTSKGGVGKTTISAHLAGGFAISGYSNVVLLDLDTQGNLRKLLGDGVAIPEDINKGYSGSTVSVFDYYGGEWSAEDADIVICDCSPDFSSNPIELVEKFDYCIVPTTLNPLGINKNSDVIKRTIADIRSVNKTTAIFVLINSFYPGNQDKTQVTRNKKLNKILKSNFSELIKDDKNCFYIDPIDDFSIRHSTSLLYWGYESIIENSTPSLAFKMYGGRSYPKADFISLAGYIEEHTDLSSVKEEEEGMVYSSSNKEKDFLSEEFLL